MCGVCGVLSNDKKDVSNDRLIAMCRTFSYRGPDDEGVYTGGGLNGQGDYCYVGLAHRRLSIIDLSSDGHQPMSNEDGSIWITFNGEIYNYLALRSELLAKGHAFHSNTDTETILHLYEEEGTDAVKRLNGMFAFAIWDEKRGRLWLCRDRVGIKPLVYSWHKDKLVFSSEIKALLLSGWVAKGLNHRALQLYLAFSYVPAPHTIFEGIKKLMPGHSLVFENGTVSVTPYWSVPETTDERFSGLTHAQAIEAVSPLIVDTLTSAVTERMIADVPLGAFLSGGIDSSIIVALMARNTTTPVKTFSVGFTSAALFDETQFAREVSRMYRTEHHEFKLNASDMKDVLEDVIATFDEPFSDSSAIPTFIVSRETRKHVTVALSGDGGDELFAGYRSYLAWYWYDLYMRIPASMRRIFIEKIIESLPDGRESRPTEYFRRLKKFVKGTKGNQVQRMLALKEIGASQLRGLLIKPISGANRAEVIDPAIEHLSKLMRSHHGDPINRALYADTCDSLPGDMLTKVDWMSMLNSLEVRVPFLDYRMVELAFSIPGHLKIRNGITKYLLKQVFRPMLPESLSKRPKAGFEIPISRWLRTDLRFLIDQYLDPGRLTRQGIFDANVVKEVAVSFRAGRKDHSWLIWNLIVFQAWYDRYFV